METEKLLQMRRERGMAIAKTAHILKVSKNEWLVPSQAKTGAYTVRIFQDKQTCTCADFIERGLKCKHLFAVEIKQTLQVVNTDGSKTTITKKITYSQDWANYTKAQNEEGKLFKDLLKDLVGNVQEEPYTFGRPKVPLKTSLFCAIDKVYSMQSSRRAYSRYKEAEIKQMINRAPNYNVINKLLNDSKMTPILSNLLNITSLPLKSVETRFSADSTGFETTQFSEYCNIKHKQGKQHKWIKCHALTGNTTNIITSAIITDEHGADSPQFIPLVEETAKLGFDMQEISADKAYNSFANFNAVASVDATPYIPFKKNTTAKVHTGNKAWLWRKMYHYFQLNQEEFLEHYHKRSNVETTFFAIKAKFGATLKSKNQTAQVNELLCKLIAYNITVIIGAIYELGIKIEF